MFTYYRLNNGNTLLFKNNILFHIFTENTTILSNWEEIKL